MNKEDNIITDIKMELPNGKIITFTSEQYEGIQKIREWLKSDKQFFTLAGHAGTGKTTLLKKIIEENRMHLIVSAPTHKAKKVIMRMTRQEGETLHTLLGLRPDLDLDDFNPNDPKFNPIAEIRIATYNFVIIDEASMINEDLFNMIKDSIKGWNTKVLFVGDPAQIPPIGEKLSIVFNGVIDDIHELTQVMRQEDGNPLFPIYDALRNNLNVQWGGFERVTKINSKGEGVIFTDNKRKFRKLLLEKFNSVEFAKDGEFVKLIAWRNDTVMASNHIIREGIFGKNVPFLVNGDVLTAYRSVRAKNQLFNIIDNSADYYVTNVSKRIQNEFDLWGHKITLRETMVDSEFKFKTVFIVDHTDHDNLHQYAEIHDTLKEIAKANKKKWKEYYRFRRESLLMVKIDHFKNGEARHQSEIIVKDLDYGYALTCHKVQGSTYTHVFVLEDDISINKKIKERNQIKYVALTRPTKTATVLTSIK